MPGLNARRRAARSFAFAWVCHAGALEPKAVILAASLRRFAPPGSELIAAVPDGRGDLSPPVLEALGGLRVRVERFEPPFGPERPNGNSITALRIPFDADRLVLLDADMLALAPFVDRPQFDADVAAKPADVQTWSGDPEAWRRTFAAAGLAVPSERVLTTVSQEVSPPYYNGGMLVVREPRSLSDAWLACARELDGADLPYRTTWQNMPSLAAAVARLGGGVAALGEDVNFPAHMRLLPRDRSVTICHYHWPRIVRSEPVLGAAVRDLAASHPAVRVVLADAPDWRPVLEPAARRRAPAVREMLITGIPGSGGCELLSYLGREDGCVALDDVDGFAETLVADRVPWRIMAGLRAARAGLAQRSAGATGDPLLAVQESPRLLMRVDAVRSALPGARVVFCVRDPYATVAAWKTTPDPQRDAHLAIAEATWQETPYLADGDRAELRAIAGCASAAEQRARSWAWAARRVLEHRAGAVVVDAHRPGGAWRALLRGTCLRRGRTPDALTGPVDLDVLDADDREAIASHCVPFARELGLRAQPLR